MADRNAPGYEAAPASRRGTKKATKAAMPAKKAAAARKAGSTKKVATKKVATKKVATKKVATNNAIAAKGASARKAGAPARKTAAAKRTRAPKNAVPAAAPADEVVMADEVEVADQVEAPDEFAVVDEIAAQDEVALADEANVVGDVNEVDETTDPPTSVYAPVNDETTAVEPETMPEWSRPPPPSPVADAPAGEEKTKGKGKKLLLVLAVLVILGALVGGIYWLVSGGDDDGVAYTSLEPGDCFNNPPENFKRVTTVPCTGPHDLEVIAVVDDPSPTGTPYPGTATLVQLASERCAPDFQIYVGIPVEQSQLRQVEVVPQESSWDDGSRRLVCTVRSPGGEPLSRPARGSNV